MRQITFACQPSFEKHVWPSRRKQFLNTVESVVPWQESEALIAQYDPNTGRAASRSACRLCCASTFGSIGSEQPRQRLSANGQCAY